MAELSPAAQLVLAAMRRSYAPMPECRDCQRRTAPMEDNTLYSFMATPTFDPNGSCPLRIPPND